MENSYDCYRVPGGVYGLLHLALETLKEIIRKGLVAEHREHENARTITGESCGGSSEAAPSEEDTPGYIQNDSQIETAQEYNLKKDNYRRSWSQDEVSYARDNYQEMTNLEIATVLGRTESQVQVFISTHGWVRDDPTVRESQLRRLFKYLDARFGFAPFNNEVTNAGLIEWKN